MTKWEMMEEFLNDWDIAGFKTFRSSDVASVLGISGTEASELIQAYLDATANDNLSTIYVIAREGRTRNATWHMTDKPGTPHVRLVARQYADDARHRVTVHLEPLLTLISQRGDAKARRLATRAVMQIGGLLKDIEQMASLKQ